MRRLCVVLAALVAAFWFVSIEAEKLGTRIAVNLAEHLQEQPRVALYSSKNVQIPNIRPQILNSVVNAYQFRYNNLYLLYHAKGSWLLLTNAERSGMIPTVSILPDDPTTIRVDVSTR
jgi:hypothetical protein